MPLSNTALIKLLKSVYYMKLVYIIYYVYFLFSVNIWTSYSYSFYKESVIYGFLVHYICALSASYILRCKVL